MSHDVSFATFNLYNLQLPDRPMYRGKRYTQAQYDKKIDWTAKMLRSIDADVIAFQELWSPAALQAAFVAANLIDAYRIVTPDAENPRQISVALAVRQPLRVSYSRWIRDFPDDLVLRKRRASTTAEPDYQLSVAISRFSRPVLRATVAFPDDDPSIALYVAHLKSKLAMRLDDEEGDDPGIRAHSTAIGSALSTIRRTAEAAALRVLLNGTMRDTQTPVAVLGDLNDGDRSVTTSIITEQPRYKLFASSRAGRRSDRGLYAASTLQQYRSLSDDYYTHIHNDQRESLDHILVSEQFYDHSSNRVWSFRELRVMNDQLDDDDASTSDHAPIITSFDYNPA